MRFVFFKKKDIWWVLGTIPFWFVARFLRKLSKLDIPSFPDYYDYLIEGVIISSVGVIVVGFLRNFNLNEKDKVTEKKYLG